MGVEVHKLCARIIMRRGIFVALNNEEGRGTEGGGRRKPCAHDWLGANEVTRVDTRVSQNMCEERGYSRLTIATRNDKIFAVLGQLTKNLWKRVDGLPACKRGTYLGIFGRHKLHIPANHKTVNIRGDILWFIT